MELVFGIALAGSIGVVAIYDKCSRTLRKRKETASRRSCNDNEVATADFSQREKKTA